MNATPITEVFKIFKKTIYSKGLELSVAVHSSFVEILICQLCFCHF